MADDTDNVQISFTAQIDSLQEGIQLGEELIKEFTGEIATLQERISALSEVGGDWAALGAIRQYTAGIQDVSAKTDILKDKLAELSAEQSRLAVTQFKPVSMQFAIDESMRLNEMISSASASARVFQSSLGNVGISATEMAIQEREAAAATDALNRSQGSFFQSQTAGRAAVASNLSALQGQSAAYQRATTSLGGFGTASARANQEITAGTSMFRAAAGAMDQFSIRTSGAARELIVLAHEVASGRYSRIPGSLMVMGEMMTGLSVGAAAATLGIMAVVGAIGYFTYRAIELANTVRDIQIGAQFAGNADISNQAIESTILEMAKMQGMTRATAEEVVGQFARMRGMTAEDLSALTKLTAEYSQATGTTAKEAAEKLSAAIQNENLNVATLAKMFPGATDAQLENTQAVIESGNAHQREAALMLMTQQQLDRTKESTIAANSSMTASAKNFLTYIGALEAGIPYQSIENSLIEENTKKWNENAAAVKKAADALKNRPLSPEELKLQNTIDMAGIDSAGTRIKELTRSIQNFNAEMKSTPVGSDRYKELAKDAKLAQGEIDQLRHGQDKKMDYGTNLAGQEEIRQTKETNAAVSADIALSAQQQHDIVAANWQKLLDEGKLTKDQRVEVETEMHSAIGAAARAGAAETIAQARNSVAQINATEKMGASERLAAIVAVWAAVKTSDKLGYQQRLEAATEYYKAEAAAAKYASSTAISDAKSDAETAITIGHLRLAAERADTTEGFKLHQTTAAERTRLLQELAAKEEAIDEQELTAEMALIGKGNAGYEEAYNKILILREQLKNEKLRIAREEEEEDRKTAQQSVTNWRLATNEIMSAEDTLISGIVGGRETMTQILAKMIDNFVTKELEADARYLTQHLLLSNAELAADKTADQAGLLYKTLFETQKTAVVASSQAAQTAATTSGITTRTISQEYADAAVDKDMQVSLADWIAKELGMTSATVAGNAQRVASDGSAASMSKSVSGAAGGQQVMADAAKAYSGTFAFLAPEMGPFAAIPATAAFMAVAAYEGMASLAAGAWEVPHDMTANIHKGESVIPKNFAEGLRNSGNLSGTTEKMVGHTSNITYAPVINAPQQKSLPDLLSTHASAMHRFINQAIRDGSIGM